uniref:DUF4939 domain-containing protein n=1 Tax=Leptobrachium leishanense TaxID=445787 RepID=A0A8C5LSU3_9ANUR
ATSTAWWDPGTVTSRSGKMDPADLTQHLSNFVSRQHEQDLRMDQFALALQTILTRTAHLEPAGVAPPPAIPVSPVVQTSQVHMTAPMRFDGTPSECQGFLVQVDIHFKLNPQMFITDIAKVGFIINHLSGRALTWANPLWEAEKPIILNYKEFIAELKRTFNPTRKAKVAECMISRKTTARKATEETGLGCDVHVSCQRH